MRLSATFPAEYWRRKAVGAPPLERSRLAALTYSLCWNSLRIKQAAQVRANLGDKFLNVGVLGLGDA